MFCEGFQGHGAGSFAQVCGPWVFAGGHRGTLRHHRPPAAPSTSTMPWLSRRGLLGRVKPGPPALAHQQHTKADIGVRPSQSSALAPGDAADAGTMPH